MNNKDKYVCEECKHFLAKGRVFGKCRRYPTQSSTSYSGTCGEFEQKVAKQG